MKGEDTVMGPRTIRIALAALLAATAPASPSGPLPASVSTEPEDSAGEREGVFGFYVVPDGDVLLVETVYGGLPAERAGILPGDSIIAFNGVGFRFENYAEVREGLAIFKPGDEVVLTITRGSETLDFELLVGEASPEFVNSRKTAYDRAKDLSQQQQRSTAYGSFLGLAKEKEIDVEFQRDPDTEALSWHSATVALPAALDFLESPAGDPVMWEAFRILRAGDSFVLRFRVEPQGLFVEPLVAPPYLDYRSIARSQRSR